MEYDFRINPDNRIIYVPKKVVESIGTRWSMVADGNAAIVFPKDSKLDDVLASIDLIKRSFMITHKIPTAPLGKRRQC